LVWNLYDQNVDLDTAQKCGSTFSQAYELISSFILAFSMNLSVLTTNLLCVPSPIFDPELSTADTLKVISLSVAAETTAVAVAVHPMGVGLNCIERLCQHW